MINAKKLTRDARIQAIPFNTGEVQADKTLQLLYDPHREWWVVGISVLFTAGTTDSISINVGRQDNSTFFLGLEVGAKSADDTLNYAETRGDGQVFDKSTLHQQKILEVQFERTSATETINMSGCVFVAPKDKDYNSPITEEKT